MGRIHVLPDQVANKIAAGEVVERPASVVKELLENSLDAGATSLRIKIENGGRRLIRIIDNGSGMLREDVKLAFWRPPTSKPRNSPDIFSTTILGFLVEVLSSIRFLSLFLLANPAQETTYACPVVV